MHNMKRVVTVMTVALVVVWLIALWAIDRAEAPWEWRVMWETIGDLSCHRVVLCGVMIACTGRSRVS